MEKSGSYGSQQLGRQLEWKRNEGRRVERDNDDCPVGRGGGTMMEEADYCSSGDRRRRRMEGMRKGGGEGV